MSAAITRREAAIAAAGACLLAIVMTWPLVLNLGTDIPRDIGDPLAEAWQPAWGGHALVHQPLHFFQSNQFWPLHDTLAFSDALVGYAPAGLFGSGPHAAVKWLSTPIGMRMRNMPPCMSAMPGAGHVTSNPGSN